MLSPEGGPSLTYSKFPTQKFAVVDDVVVVGGLVAFFIQKFDILLLHGICRNGDVKAENLKMDCGFPKFE